jgi:cobalt-zinc-cadmium efflux system outer membrane protein
MPAHRTCALVAVGVALYARAPRSARADEPRSLDEATFLAELATRSPRLRAGAAAAEAADAAVDAAGVRPNPSLRWEREAVPSFDSHDDFVELTLPLDLSGRRGLAISAARGEARAAAADADRAALALVIDARRAYAIAAAARQRVAALEASRVRLAELVESLRTRAASGDTAQYDAERVALELDLLDDDLSTARRELAEARIVLGGLLGTPEAPVDAADDLQLPAAIEPTAPARDDVAAARHRAAAARGELRHARRGWFPRLELGVGLLIAGAGDEDGLGYLVTVGAELPLLDRGGAAARKAAAAAERWEAEAEALAAEATAGAAAATAAVSAAADQARTFREGAARRAAKLTASVEVAYREGDRSIVELLDALRADRSAQVRVVELFREAREAELELWLAQGRAP